MATQSKSNARVQAALDARGWTLEVVELPASTRTAREAAAAIGCTVSQIAKSIVFRGEDSDDPVLVVASGTNRVDDAAVAAVVGEPVALASPDFVRQATGFAIGGVAPCGHPQPLRILLDEDLANFELLWAAAGTPRSVFSITPDQLGTLTGGEWSRLAAG